MKESLLSSFLMMKNFFDQRVYTIAPGTPRFVSAIAVTSPASKVSDGMLKIPTGSFKFHSHMETIYFIILILMKIAFIACGLFTWISSVFTNKTMRGFPGCHKL